MSNAGNIKSPFNIFTSGGENDEVSCFLIMHSRAPEPRNSRSGNSSSWESCSPGPSLFTPFPPISLSALTRSSSSTNLPFRHRVSTISDILPLSFLLSLFSYRVYILFPAWRGEQVLSLLFCLFLLLDSSLSVRRGDDYEAARSSSSPELRRARRFSCLSFCVPSNASAIFPFLHPSIHPSIHPGCAFF